jgi:hypothetical protein
MLKIGLTRTVFHVFSGIPTHAKTPDRNFYNRQALKKAELAILSQ